MAPLASRLFLVAALALALLPAFSAAAKARYTGVLSFGDSLADTGNELARTGGGAASVPPYGETFFGRPTGRSSDGRLVLDFIVAALGMSYPKPYFAGEAAADFQRGVNFAFSGSTALGPEFFKSRGLTPFVPLSLANQTAWFKKVLQLAGSVHEQRKLTSKSLVMMGEIGINDYLVALMAKRTGEEVRTFVPHIVGAISSLLTEVIGAGARTVVVRGMIPLGCQPIFLVLLEGTGADHGRETGCLTWLNDLAKLHNRALMRMVSDLRRAHPGRAILYADQYSPVAAIVRSPRKYGFGDRPLVACCGGSGTYNFTLTTFCGVPGVAACADPSKYVSWDGIHMTDAANRNVAGAVLRSTILRQPLDKVELASS
ncbi:GDSL esterase/lipase At1g28600-like isoform X1 [Aegilops tauschii subsp. strangulata]|uniref:GDSL esterase/lipase n=3 Tax=Aegilops tauschii subsp. strangulata TaxID=200361 RepID=A0A453SXV7_AEGTS|nr:GDSL esterase/lipase At1g28600-like isoform X1 [Aegilops tauschii subsp. strangulata]